jgi:diadenosine tetraphosphate (Ap4A) HIT family hydrolase
MSLPAAPAIIKRVGVQRSFAALAFLLLPLSRADVRGCLCDVAKPETMAARECSLCREAETQPADVQFFLLRDVNPNKPNRWLALPRFHGRNPQQLSDMTPEQRTGYWSAAIAKARELWGDEWGIAVNSADRRTQCHAHMHIGKLLPDVEDDRFVLVDGPAAIPTPDGGDGIWIHPAGAGLHAHTGEPAGELKLLR